MMVPISRQNNLSNGILELSGWEKIGKECKVNIYHFWLNVEWQWHFFSFRFTLTIVETVQLFAQIRHRHLGPKNKYRSIPVFSRLIHLICSPRKSFARARPVDCMHCMLFVCLYGTREAQLGLRFRSKQGRSFNISTLSADKLVSSSTQDTKQVRLPLSISTTVRTVCKVQTRLFLPAVASRRVSEIQRAQHIRRS